MNVRFWYVFVDVEHPLPRLPHARPPARPPCILRMHMPALLRALRQIARLYYGQMGAEGNMQRFVDSLQGEKMLPGYASLR